MKKGNIELQPITEAQVFDPPKRMYCWNALNGHPVKAYVVAILPKSSGVTSNVICTPTYCNYEYCAEIPEAPNPRRATNRELSKWLAHGNGECLGSRGDADTAWYYPCECSDVEVRDGAKVRKWCDKDWHEPTAEYLGIKEAE